ncbi:holdfast anchoring protein HfaA [uncultured Maricaulis sp.]|jgi:holdfast attachment protein HfaA|uniref:holdfast anchoring protein HfaA n=1 Tax=uncultured Maricaulis sp. TaxID=174710 RepID=UPI0030DB042E
MKTRSFPTVLGAALALAAISAAAQAQRAETTAGWEQPYGGSTAQASQPWSGATASAGAAARSSAGNRVIIDGIIQTGVGVSTQTGLFGGGVGANATAIGNQLNVSVSGQWNTVIVNSTQTNNGDINANSQAQGNVSTDNDQD